MYRFRFYILCLLVLLPISSFAFMVGGTCTYETLYGIACISEQGSDETLARFQSQDPLREDSPLLMFRSLEFSVPRPVAGGIGTPYPAELRVRTSGSCSPAIMTLVATEEFSRSIVIELDSDGQIGPDAQQQLDQLAKIFIKLTSSWPQLYLKICGQSSAQGSDESHLSLGDRYARNVAQEFESLGVVHSKIKISCCGEHRCPEGVSCVEKGQNGVSLTFVLADAGCESF